MAIHELKTDSRVFQATKAGIKRYELRKNDRSYRVGDTLILKETQHCGADMAEFDFPLIYTGEEIQAKVNHILYGPIYGLEAGWCIMNIEAVCD
jgi:hypothetical protein